MARKRIKPTPAEEDGDLDGGQPQEPVEDLSQQTEATDRGFFAGEDERLRRSADGQRRSRAEEDPAIASERGSGLVSSPHERRRAFRDEWTQEALPSIPPVPGWHFCWLSSTNQWDPIQRRMRMGYTAVKPEEVPGFEHLTQKSGQWEGCIGINEMVLFKIPATLYQQMMTEFHHDQPLEEEAAIRSKVEDMTGDLRDSEGTPLVQMEPDMMQLGRRPRRNPTFN